MTATPSTFLLGIDKSVFSIEAYCKAVPKPWGRELHLCADGGPYMTKIIEIKAGARLSLQAHDAKTETWTLFDGRAGLMLENADGELVEIELEVGVAYTSQLGQRHRLFGITDCRVFEASTPEIGTTLRLEDDYARPDETEVMRADPNRGWNAT